MNLVAKKMVARALAASLVIGSGYLVKTAVMEGYTDTAVQPVKGDKWTKGYGDTIGETGAGVKKGDKTDPVRALIQLQKNIDNVAAKIRACLDNVPVSQGEWEGLLDLGYNNGPGAVCSRAKPGKPPQLMDLFHLKQYDAACERMKEFNCGPSGNPGVTVDKCGPGKTILKGLVNRRKETYSMCMRDKEVTNEL